MRTLVRWLMLALGAASVVLFAVPPHTHGGLDAALFLIAVACVGWFFARRRV